MMNDGNSAPVDRPVIRSRVLYACLSLPAVVGGGGVVVVTRRVVAWGSTKPLTPALMAAAASRKRPAARILAVGRLMPLPPGVLCYAVPVDLGCARGRMGLARGMYGVCDTLRA